MGIGVEKLFVIALIAMFLVGPEKLPDYAQRLGRFVRSARRMLDDAKERVREEMGPDFDDVDWQKLDPRQYDPRRIIRDALLDSPSSGAAAATAATVTAAKVRAPAPIVPLGAGEAAPFDSEAT